jgi:hypothetical protein
MKERNLLDNVATGDLELDAACNAFLKNVTEKVLDTQVNHERHPNLPPYVLKVSPDGQNFIRICQMQGEHHLSSWCFIARKDGQNKAMGAYRRGQIFKCDGWKTPAKHARGDVFQPGENGCCNVNHWTGPDYLIKSYNLGGNTIGK